MKLIILKKNLRDALGIIERAVAQENTLPILHSFVLKTIDGKIALEATNLEIAITTIVFGKIIDTGGIALPFSAFSTIVSAITSERINLEVNTHTLLISTDNYNAKIQGVSLQDFPIIPVIENPKATFTIQSDVLSSALTQVVPAAQFSEIRPELASILFLFQLTTIKLVATDSFRLAEKTLFEQQFSTQAKELVKFIIPLKTIHEVIRAFKEGGDVTITIDEHQVLFSTSNTRIISRIIDAVYPDYEQIIPHQHETQIEIERTQFIQAIKLVSSFSGKLNDVHLRLGSDKKVIELFSSDQYLGENKYLIAIKGEGAPIEDVSFNWKYLIDGLRVCSGDQLTCWFNGVLKPALFRVVNDASYVYVVMPIRLS